MYKKLLIILFLYLFIISCGKKSDPIYQKETGLIKMKLYGTSES